MKNTDNQYLFDKLNNKFDRDLDTLKERYDRDAQMLMYGDASGLNMTKRRNRLWMWFDRKTQFRVFPKIMVAITMIHIITWIIALNTDFFNSIMNNGSMLFALVTFSLAGQGFYYLMFNSNRSSGYNPNDDPDFQAYLCNPTVSPLFRNYPGNTWNRDE